MLREMKWGVQNGPLTKNGVTTSFIVDLMYQIPKCPYSCIHVTGLTYEAFFPCEYP